MSILRSLIPSARGYSDEQVGEANPIAFATLSVLGGGAYYWLILQSGSPATSYTLNLAEMRRLADATPGPKAREIRAEHVVQFSFPATAIVAGDGWVNSAMTVFSYQLEFGDKTVIIDTAMSAGQASTLGGAKFDTKAYARLSNALKSASLIVVTHEHGDRIGGLLAQPDLKVELTVAKLNVEQVTNLERYNPGYPKAAFAGYKPLDYRNYQAVAPGVVLIRAADHTPGSQMVYVRTENSGEYLFTGDVAWHMRNIDTMRDRARLVTWLFLREDRDAVLAQLAALNALKKAEPKIHIVPGHDPEVVTALERDGLILKTFR